MPFCTCFFTEGSSWVSGVCSLPRRLGLRWTPALSMSTEPFSPVTGAEVLGGGCAPPCTHVAAHPRGAPRSRRDGAPVRRPELPRRAGAGAAPLSALPRLPPQRPVCDRAEMPAEGHGEGVRGQVHQEAPPVVQPAGGQPGGDRAGGEHPAGDPAPQHHHAARHLREQDRCGAHPGAGLRRGALRLPGRKGVADGGRGHPVPQADPGRRPLPALQAHCPL